MNFLLVPDSFKGSMSAKRVCEVLSDAIRSKMPTAQIKMFPALDGGEGSAEYLTEILNGKMVETQAKNATFGEETSTFGLCGETAVIAVANTSGLPQAKIKDPAKTTTYGMGEQILCAIGMGAKKIVLALGGSSTNDGGAGAAAALGAVFIDKNGKKFVPTGGNLEKIEKIDVSALKKNVKGVRFVGLCDVKNPLTGENGCSYVYGKQKGAITREMQDALEKNMREYAKKTEFLDVDENTQGAGAAGGLGYFVKAFLKGELVSGADYFLDTIGFETEAKNADVIVCGEGKFDNTSAQGKICGRIRDRAEKIGKKVIVFCGAADADNAPGVQKVYTINDPEKNLEENMKSSEQNLYRTAQKMMGEIGK